jgi:hypothetical protein
VVNGERWAVTEIIFSAGCASKPVESIFLETLDRGKRETEVVNGGAIAHVGRAINWSGLFANNPHIGLN